MTIFIIKKGKYFSLTTLAILFLFMSGCIPNNLFEENEKLYFKEIQNPEIKIEWFYCSTVTFVTADSVKIFSDSLNIQKTLCVSDNIADVTLSNKDITISFFGYPQLRGERINIADSIFGYGVLIDTNSISSGHPTFRKFYKAK